MIYLDVRSDELSSSLLTNHSSNTSHKDVLLTPEYITPHSGVTYNNKLTSDLAMIDQNTSSESAVKVSTELSVAGESSYLAMIDQDTTSASAVKFSTELLVAGESSDLAMIVEDSDSAVKSCTELSVQCESTTGRSINPLSNCESAKEFTEKLNRRQSSSCTESNLLNKFHKRPTEIPCQANEKQRTNCLSLNSLNESQSEINSHEHSQETTNELISEMETESIPKHLSVNGSTKDCLLEKRDKDCSSIGVTSETGSVEDIQLEECQHTANDDDICTIYESAMEVSATESTAEMFLSKGDESKDVRFSEDLDKKAASVENSNMIIISDLLDECTESSKTVGHCFSEEGVVPFDESVPDDRAGASKVPEIVDDSCEIRILESRSIANDIVIDTTMDTDLVDRNNESGENSALSLENSAVILENDAVDLENSAVGFDSGNDFTAVLDDYSPTAELLEPAHNPEAIAESQSPINDVKNIGDNVSQETGRKVSQEETESKISHTIQSKISLATETKISHEKESKISHETETKISLEIESKISHETDDKMSEETDYKSKKAELRSDKNKPNLNTKVTGLTSGGDSCVSGPTCEVKNADVEATQTSVDKDESCTDVLGISNVETILADKDNVFEIKKTHETKCETKKVNNEKKELDLFITLDSSVSGEETYSHIDEEVTLLDEKENVNKLNQTTKADSGFKTQRLDNVVKGIEEKQEEICSDQDNAGRTEKMDVNNDDDVLFLDDAKESKPPECSIEMPELAFKEKLTLISEEGCVGIEIDSDQDLTSKPNEEKTVTQILEVDDKKLEVSLNRDVQTIDSASAAECSRKRLQEEDSSPAAKRSRLDSMIEKLEDEKSTEAVPQVLDSEDDDDVILTEEPSVIKDVTEETTKSTDSSPIVLTSEALRSLIELRVKAFLKVHKRSSLDRLNLRAKGLMSASSLWKETAKHLEKSVAELTVLNQKLEKRKAYCDSMKQTENKNKAIQGNEGVRNSVSPLVNNASNKRQEASPSTVMHYLPQSPQAQRMDMRQQRGNHSNIKNPAFATQSPVLRASIRPGYSSQLHSSPNTPALPLWPTQIPQGRMPQTQVIRSPAAASRSVNNVVNLIDLTDDDDYSKRTITQATQYTPTQQRTNNVSRMGGSLAVSESRNTQFGLPLHRPNIPIGSNNQTLHRPAPGFQQPNSQSNRAGFVPNSQHQPVNISKPLSPRTAGFQALTPGSRQRFPNNIHVSGHSNINRRALQQNTAQNSAAASKPMPLSLPPSFHISAKHPAPLPTGMDSGNAPPTAKKRPPKPSLKISRVSHGIVLSWNMPPLNDVETISSYQLFAYQESESTLPKSFLWKKVGDVKALPLPMACTLTQFEEGNKYHFAVRAVDQYGRWGTYSDPNSIFLAPKS